MFDNVTTLTDLMKTYKKKRNKIAKKKLPLRDVAQLQQTLKSEFIERQRLILAYS